MRGRGVGFWGGKGMDVVLAVVAVAVVVFCVL